MKEAGLRALIVTKKSILPVWRDELEEAGELATMIVGTPKKKQKLLASEGHHIITYESSWRLVDSLHPYDVVVFDEALKLQNGTSSVGSHWRLMASKFRKVKMWGLSGAPCPEGALQLANQMFIMHRQWQGQAVYQTYVWQNWTWDENRYKFKPKDPRHPRKCTKDFEDSSFKISQKELGMGEKIFEVRYVEASRAEEKLLLDNIALAQSDYDNSTDYRTEAMYRQASSSGIDAETKSIIDKPSKLMAVADAVIDMLESSPTEQVVVMTRFINSGKWIANAVGAHFVYGQTNDTDREQWIKAYQTAKTRVLVAQVDAVKEGIDFAANGNGSLIFAEHSWSGNTFIQATQRASNTERKTPSLIITFCTKFKKDCIDYNIYNAVKNKKDFNAKLLEK